MPYDITNWYWQISDSALQVFSSAEAAYVPITNSVYQAWLLSGNAPTPLADEQFLIDIFNAQYTGGWAALALRISALAALAASDRTLLRCQENSIAFPSAWQAFRKQLRIIASGANEGPLPSAPSFPPGS